MQKPMVSSVMIECMVTEMFIRQAIEGVDAAMCIWSWIYNGNDCSPDGTDAVIRNTINAHPNGKG
jgi:hypothetical protein